MAGIKGIEKLREVIGADASQLGYTNGTKKLHELIDEIEREIENDYVPRVAFRALQQEISERYMELPIDADGVPIRMGDYITDGDNAGIVEGFVSSTPNGNGYPVPIDINEYMYMQCISHHVKQRTIEDVLAEFFYESRNSYTSEKFDLVDKYADEIRGLL